MLRSTKSYVPGRSRAKQREKNPATTHPPARKRGWDPSPWKRGESFCGQREVAGKTGRRYTPNEGPWPLWPTCCVNQNTRKPEAKRVAPLRRLSIRRDASPCRQKDVEPNARTAAPRLLRQAVRCKTFCPAFFGGGRPSKLGTEGRLLPLVSF